jgi:hypothetical protein
LINGSTPFVHLIAMARHSVRDESGSNRRTPLA